ncbi:hypothetical protein AYI70_g2644 [Smittium culicis]|uniref:CCHC-type domain-containing protein n=1 Tax=Smittium culicis TaxID=133412 RepID=A0A1R1Y726_9FUNG|nr:hypothetical protein AYI70_g2644 [Smittium culicis]
METSHNSNQNQPSQSWAKVVNSNQKPPDIQGIGIRKKLIGKNPNYKPVSLLEMVSGSKPNNKKILCMGGTPFKLGHRINDHGVDTDLVIESILEQLGDIQTCFEVDDKRKIVFFKFIDKVNQEKAKKKEIIYNQKKIELLETSEYSDEYKYITVPSYTGLSVWEVAQSIYNELKKIGEVIDITALKHVKFNSYPSKSLKIVLKTKNDKDIPSTLSINESQVVLLWKGGQNICTYCKKIDHWKNQCPEIRIKNEKKLKRARESNPKNIIKKIFVEETLPNKNNNRGTSNSKKGDISTIQMEKDVANGKPKSENTISPVDKVDPINISSQLDSPNFENSKGKDNNTNNENKENLEEEPENTKIKNKLPDIDYGLVREPISLFDRKNLKNSGIRKTLNRLNIMEAKFKKAKESKLIIKKKKEKDSDDKPKHIASNIEQPSKVGTFVKTFETPVTHDEATNDPKLKEYNEVGGEETNLDTSNRKKNLNSENIEIEIEDSVVNSMSIE